ncbi:MAG: hypothetical protein ABR541_00860 [Candidatus Dormibacteria bacterium]
MPRLHRLLVASLCLPGALVGLVAASQPAAADPSGTVNPACLNLPSRPAEITALDCRWTGPESMVLAGGSAQRPADGRVLVIDGQHRQGFTLVGAGSARLRAVTAGHACVVVPAGAIDLDLSSGRTGPCAGLATPAVPPAVQSDAQPSASSGIPLTSTPVLAAAPLGPLVAGAVPPASISSYIYGDTRSSCPAGAGFSCTLTSQGARATPGSLVILDLGSPCFVPGTTTYGTQLFNTSSCTPLTQDAVLLADFLQGYEGAHAAGSAPLILAAGTSNSLTGADPQANYALSSAQMQAHAQGWFSALVQPTQHAALAGPAPVTVWAAGDIEQSSGGDYYGPVPSIPWVDAYAAASGHPSGAFPCDTSSRGMLADYGDDVVGAGGWSQGQIYHVAWGSSAACAVPEIYYTSMATEWAQMNSWAAANNLSTIPFTGVMSEGGAAGTLSAGASWSALSNATGQAVPYLTIISSAEPVGNPAPTPPPPPPGTLPPPAPMGSIAVRGGDAGLWRSDAGAAWAGLGGMLNGAPAVVVVPASSSAAANHLEVVTGGDNRLWVRTDTTTWTQLSSQFTSCRDNPAAALVPGSRTLTVVCTGGDLATWMASGSIPTAGNPVLNGWSSLGGLTRSGPALGPVNGHLQVLVDGTDGQVWQGGAGLPWVATGWRCIGHPALAAAAGISYFGCHGTDGALWYATNSGAGWSAARSAGGALVDGIGIAASGAQAMFAVEGTDGALWYSLVSGTGAAGPFATLGGRLTQGAAAGA